MLHLKRALTSTLGQKFLTSLTGAGMVGFLIFHLISNLSLFDSNPNSYNLLSHSLVQWGTWLLIAELILLGLLGIHVLLAIHLKTLSIRARPISYQLQKTKGGPSKKGFSSTQLIVTGLVILVFIVIHVFQFKFGPGIREGYSVLIRGTKIRDVHRLVVETFRIGYWSLFYLLSLVFLGFHLRHGIWSLFQSLGMLNQRTTHPVYILGTVLAFALTLGFASIPMSIWLGGGGPAH